MKHVLLCAVLLAPLQAASPALWAEDVWDRAGSSDDSALSQNELAPGTSQVHDMEATGGMPDEDWYRISLKPFSSYEIIVDGTTSGMGVIPVNITFDDLAVELMNGSTSLEKAIGLGTSGAARSLRFRNESAAEIQRQIRVNSPECNASCGANQQYTIRLLETTYNVARFNNSGSQITLLIIQNTAGHNVSLTARFLDSNGVQAGIFAASMPALGSLVVNTAGAIAGGSSGSIIVTHDGRYGGLVGKAVSVEAATGFTFDTALVPRLQ